MKSIWHERYELDELARGMDKQANLEKQHEVMCNFRGKPIQALFTAPGEGYFPLEARETSLENVYPCSYGVPA